MILVPKQNADYDKCILITFGQHGLDGVVGSRKLLMFSLAFPPRIFLGGHNFTQISTKLFRTFLLYLDDDYYNWLIRFASS